MKTYWRESMGSSRSSGMGREGRLGLAGSLPLYAVATAVDVLILSYGILLMTGLIAADYVNKKKVNKCPGK